MTDTSKEAVDRFEPEPWDIRRADMKRDPEGVWVRYNDYAALLRERDEAREALKTTGAWLNRWAVHVGSCAGGGICTCGLTRAQYEIACALTGKERG